MAHGGMHASMQARICKCAGHTYIVTQACPLLNKQDECMQAKSLGMTTVLIQSKTMLEETGYTLERYVLINI